MDNPASLFTTVFMAFFAIMNPIANAPLFMGLTEGLDLGARRRIALRSVALAFVIVALFATFGRQIFILFGITLPAFRIAGGILVGLVGYHLLQGQQSSIHTPTGQDNALSRDAVLGVAITPLALPGRWRIRTIPARRTRLSGLVSASWAQVSMRSASKWGRRSCMGWARKDSRRAR